MAEVGLSPKTLSNFTLAVTQWDQECIIGYESH